ncbi:MAG: bifunctional enoyl-CoA hydratase/phosphate acetyltransferase [Eubacteriales bacterium]|nr:bifunctional enoyl-CoA hydratase/phosphate acetyltransferase [Bacillota bacterium]MBV1727352.1 bifunctional enoyl-CoA hydratase/phosphate acetyltransferase [Desulforudis sp.]MDZ4043499.1 bifunctional enoyl-CoA hydratase/phosphate acetyltransferase [Eubacteriales bacterium]MBU4533483.1 bifunctional enoyl-CoA hydratase/phosphate acetyltransferase [Bacillota bacterium]MBU4554855.1 bifunctional enoyl-CoA hydratase/phosphate acetyltransferase [Bacillota bacterium]
MAFENFRQVFTELKNYRKPKLCVAAAADETVLQAVRDARKEDLVDFILVGHEEKIWRMAMTISLNLGGIEIINVRDPLEAVQRAVGAVAKGQADFLMKGMVNTTDLLRAVLNRESGLRTGNLLSHIAVYEIPGYYRLIYMTDGGINITPDLEQKKAIIQNAVDFMRSVGLERPCVAVLSANELINPKMPSSVDAGRLKEMAQSGEIRGAEIDGPIALDVAINLEAAEHKGLESPVAGRADLLAVPNIEAGNLLGKSIMYFAGGKMAGLVLGAARPIVVTSRHETPYGKMASIALGAYSVVRNESNS